MLMVRVVGWIQYIWWMRWSVEIWVFRRTLKPMMMFGLILVSILRMQRICSHVGWRVWVWIHRHGMWWVRACHHAWILTPRMLITASIVVCHTPWTCATWTAKASICLSHAVFEYKLVRIVLWKHWEIRCTCVAWWWSWILMIIIVLKVWSTSIILKSGRYFHWRSETAAISLIGQILSSIFRCHISLEDIVKLPDLVFGCIVERMYWTSQTFASLSAETSGLIATREIHVLVWPKRRIRFLK